MAQKQNWMLESQRRREESYGRISDRLIQDRYREEVKPKFDFNIDPDTVEEIKKIMQDRERKAHLMKDMGFRKRQFNDPYTGVSIGSTIVEEASVEAERTAPVRVPRETCLDDMADLPAGSSMKSN